MKRQESVSKRRCFDSGESINPSQRVDATKDMTTRGGTEMTGHDLPEEEFLYISSRTPLINVDLFIVNEFGEVLLSWRDDEHCGTGWHIPGGIIRHGETMMSRLRLTSERELGFIPQFEDEPCKITEIFLQQNYRNHFISLLYKGKCRKADVTAVDEYENHRIGDLCWFSHYTELVYSQAAYDEFLKDYFKNSHQKTVNTQDVPRKSEIIT